jgi:glycerol-3-phosphate dehydrogenase
MPPSPSSSIVQPGSFKRDLSRLTQTPFDLLVIGGGAIGTSIARDAALRGLFTALVEREDFGYGTVSRSTRLIHGGLRYLELYDFKLVREALRERETLLRIAPHLVRPLPFLTPIYRGDRWSPFMVGAGMLLYDLLSFDKSLPGHRILDVAETLRLEPGLRQEGLLGAALYYDAQVASPERLCLAQARSAADAGAVCANHLDVVRLLEENGKVVGAEGEDRLTGDRLSIHATITVNATGPWAGDLVPPQDGKPRLRRTKGAHLIVPKLTDHAVVLLAQRDGRVYFVVPWEGRTMIGTTDTDFQGDPADAVASSADARYLLEETKRVFPHADLRRIDAGFSGVRPLLPNTSVHESQVTREHRLFDHAEEGKPGLISVFGGKITTTRAIAEQAVDRVARQLEKDTPCTTSEWPLWGGDLTVPLQTFTERIRKRCKEIGLEAGVAEELVAAYGSHAGDVLALYPKHGDLEFTRFEYGVKEEMALTTADLLLRRTLRGYEKGQARNRAEETARWLGKRLQRSEDAIQADLADYHRQADLLLVEPLADSKFPT